jgi:hypothetical protein
MNHWIELNTMRDRLSSSMSIYLEVRSVLSALCEIRESSESSLALLLSLCYRDRQSMESI